MKITLEINLDSIVQPHLKATFEAYFRGQITALEACNQIGWTRMEWEKHMAGIVSAVVRSNQLGKAKNLAND